MNDSPAILETDFDHPIGDLCYEICSCLNGEGGTIALKWNHSKINKSSIREYLKSIIIYTWCSVPLVFVEGSGLSSEVQKQQQISFADILCEDSLWPIWYEAILVSSKTTNLPQECQLSLDSETEVKLETGKSMSIRLSIQPLPMGHLACMLNPKSIIEDKSNELLLKIKYSNWFNSLSSYDLVEHLRKVSLMNGGSLRHNFMKIPVNITSRSSKVLGCLDPNITDLLQQHWPSEMHASPSTILCFPTQTTYKNIDVLKEFIPKQLEKLIQYDNAQIVIGADAMTGFEIGFYLSDLSCDDAILFDQNNSFLCSVYVNNLEKEASSIIHDRHLFPPRSADQISLEYIRLEDSSPLAWREHRCRWINSNDESLFLDILRFTRGRAAITTIVDPPNKSIIIPQSQYMHLIQFNFSSSCSTIYTPESISRLTKLQKMNWESIGVDFNPENSSYAVSVPSNYTSLSSSTSQESRHAIFRTSSLPLTESSSAGLTPLPRSRSDSKQPAKLDPKLIPYRFLVIAHSKNKIPSTSFFKIDSQSIAQNTRSNPHFSTSPDQEQHDSRLLEVWAPIPSHVEGQRNDRFGCLDIYLRSRCLRPLAKSACECFGDPFMKILLVDGPIDFNHCLRSLSHYIPTKQIAKFEMVVSTQSKLQHYMEFLHRIRKERILTLTAFNWRTAARIVHLDRDDVSYRFILFIPHDVKDPLLTIESAVIGLSSIRADCRVEEIRMSTAKHFGLVINDFDGSVRHPTIPLSNPFTSAHSLQYHPSGNFFFAKPHKCTELHSMSSKHVPASQWIRDYEPELIQVLSKDYNMNDWKNYHRMLETELKLQQELEQAKQNTSPLDSMKIMVELQNIRLTLSNLLKDKLIELQKLLWDYSEHHGGILLAPRPSRAPNYKYVEFSEEEEAWVSNRHWELAVGLIGEEDAEVTLLASEPWVPPPPTNVLIPASIFRSFCDIDFISDHGGEEDFPKTTTNKAVAYSQIQTFWHSSPAPWYILKTFFVPSSYSESISDALFCIWPKLTDSVCHEMKVYKTQPGAGATTAVRQACLDQHSHGATLVLWISWFNDGLLFEEAVEKAVVESQRRQVLVVLDEFPSSKICHAQQALQRICFKFAHERKFLLLLILNTPRPVPWAEYALQQPSSFEISPLLSLKDKMKIGSMQSEIGINVKDYLRDPGEDAITRDKENLLYSEDPLVRNHIFALPLNSKSEWPQWLEHRVIQMRKDSSLMKYARALAFVSAFASSVELDPSRRSLPNILGLTGNLSYYSRSMSTSITAFFDLFIPLAYTHMGSASEEDERLVCVHPWIALLILAIDSELDRLKQIAESAIVEGHAPTKYRVVLTSKVTKLDFHELFNYWTNLLDFYQNSDWKMQQRMKQSIFWMIMTKPHGSPISLLLSSAWEAYTPKGDDSSRLDMIMEHFVTPIPFSVLGHSKAIIQSRLHRMIINSKEMKRQTQSTSIAEERIASPQQSLENTLPSSQQQCLTTSYSTDSASNRSSLELQCIKHHLESSMTLSLNALYNTLHRMVLCSNMIQWCVFNKKDAHRIQDYIYLKQTWLNCLQELFASFGQAESQLPQEFSEIDQFISNVLIKCLSLPFISYDEKVWFVEVGSALCPRYEMLFSNLANFFGVPDLLKPHPTREVKDQIFKEQEEGQEGKEVKEAEEALPEKQEIPPIEKEGEEAGGDIPIERPTGAIFDWIRAATPEFELHERDDMGGEISAIQPSSSSKQSQATQQPEQEEAVQEGRKSHDSDSIEAMMEELPIDEPPTRIIL